MQTDDSYLKIARRLNEYRTNKTQPLGVYATPLRPTPKKSATHDGGDGSGQKRRPRVSIMEPPKEIDDLRHNHGHGSSDDEDGRAADQGDLGMSSRFARAAQKIRQSFRFILFAFKYYFLLE